MAPRRFLSFLLTAMALFANTVVVVVVSQNYAAVRPNCSTTDNYTVASLYQVNLFKLMHDLEAGAIENRGFNTSREGDPPDAIFGLAMCYADVNWDQCQKCIEAATASAEQTCPFSRRMKASYKACILRYSDESFSSVADLSVASYTSIDVNATDMAGMNTTGWKLMVGLIREASNSSLRWANGSVVFSDSDGSSQVLYGLVQCTKDLSASECTRCLTDFTAKLSSSHSNGSNYGAIKGYSCYVVYQIGRKLGITIPPPPSQLTPPSPSSTSPPSYTKVAGLVVGVSVGSLVVIITLAILAWRCLEFSTKGMTLEQELGVVSDGELQEEEEFKKGAVPKRFHYRDLAVATRYFSDELKLGEGGFGSVYHGYINDINLHVAIKRVSKNSNQGRKEYESEVKIISRLRHHNLVELIGWNHHRDELLLVYELMPNGSLDTHIHNLDNVLPWTIRYDIVLGIGSALLYLHQDCQQCVLHRDIKPSNVMLDASFNAKLGDFGLARLVDHGRDSHTTVLAGTIGYIDPDCMIAVSACAESDVYSFGVIILEVACGRPPRIENAEGIRLHLVQWAWEFYGRGRILEVADPRLDSEFDSMEMERVIITALWCAHPDRAKRPSIREAMSVLRRELPSLPAKMPVAMFVPPPLDKFQTNAETGTGGSRTWVTTGSIGAA
ncbi:hypothetical protein HU200_058354 [Digitaria exilis]|uniref:Uncharacterized protein n=1 Tax=Digitaria exilis TaxID=1010633 RepID=A0A835AN06_9POAL|nr:hypothetical protein HU200_058354 [Digitaria exilis]